VYACVLVDKPLSDLGLVAVRTVDKLRVLIHEKELLTGSPGRVFFICNNPETAVRISDNSSGFEVAACLSNSPPDFYSPVEFLESEIGVALVKGWLFTNEV
jgi:hypothetical protein